MGSFQIDFLMIRLSQHTFHQPSSGPSKVWLLRAITVSLAPWSKDSGLVGLAPWKGRDQEEWGREGIAGGWL